MMATKELEAVVRPGFLWMEWMEGLDSPNVMVVGASTSHRCGTIGVYIYSGEAL